MRKDNKIKNIRCDENIEIIEKNDCLYFSTEKLKKRIEDLEKRIRRIEKI